MKIVFLSSGPLMAGILKEYLQVCLKGENLDGVIDFEKIFGRCGVVHIEVGSGKGTFLVSEAGARPGENFLGIEWARKYYRFAVDRTGRWGLKNVRIIRTDAAQFIAEHLGDNSVDCFHIYFPDPWPKKRHHKRRFLCEANLEQLIRCLKPCGTIQIATDYAEYFEQIERLLSTASGIEKVEFTRPANAEEGELVGTNYERKYIRDKRRIYKIAAKKLKS